MITAWIILLSSSLLAAVVGVLVILVHTARSRPWPTADELRAADSFVDFSRAMIHERTFVAFVFGAALVACALVGHSGLALKSALPVPQMPAISQPQGADSISTPKHEELGGIKLHWIWKPLFVANGLHIWRAVCGVWLGTGVYCAFVSGVALISTSVSNADTAVQPTLQALLGASPTSVVMLSISPVLLAIALPPRGQMSTSSGHPPTADSTSTTAGGSFYKQPRATALQVAAIVLFSLWRVLGYFASKESIAHDDINRSIFSGGTDAWLRVASLALAGAELFWVSSTVDAFPASSGAASPIAQLLRRHNRALIIAAAVVDTCAMLCFPASIVSAVATVQAVHSVSFGVVLPVLFLAAARTEATRLDLAKATAAITRFGKEVGFETRVYTHPIAERSFAVSSIHRRCCENCSCPQETASPPINCGQFLVK